MNRTRHRQARFRTPCFGALLVVGTWWAVACGGPEQLGGPGERCFRSDDCHEGLVCIELACSSDLSGNVSTVEGPPQGNENAGGAPGGAAGNAGMPGSAGTPGSAGMPGTAGTPGSAGMPGTDAGVGGSSSAGAPSTGGAGGAGGAG